MSRVIRAVVALVVVVFAVTVQASSTWDFPITDQNIGAASAQWMDWSQQIVPKALSEVQELIGEHEGFRSDFDSMIHTILRGLPRIHRSESDEVGEQDDDKDDCCKCVHTHAEHIISKVLEYMKKRCENGVICPHCSVSIVSLIHLVFYSTATSQCAKHHCSSMEHEPEFARGVILAHTHPHGNASFHDRRYKRCRI